MNTHLSIRKLNFTKAQNSGGSFKVVTLFKVSVQKVHKQYANNFEKIRDKVSKVFANVFWDDAWENLSSEQKKEIKTISDLHQSQETFEAQDWGQLLKTN